jgi:prephenate dehydrogenase
MRVAILGLGLIGGSVARALRSRPSDGAFILDRIAAWSPTGDGPRSALREGVIDEAAPTPEAALEGADLVLLAGPAPVCLAQLDDLAGPWRSALTEDAVITDVASTKSAIVLRATALGLRFVGGHPMAGRETSGYGASSEDLFVGRPWVVVPSTDDEATRRVEQLATATGAVPTRMSAAAHDEAVAAVSHLPLIVAAALVEAVAGRSGEPETSDRSAIATLASSGWRDMTRLARGDVTMGSGIVTTNASAIAPRIRAMIEVLETWHTSLERRGGPDPEEIASRLRSARERLESMP